jgi:hypothetical protein
MVKDAFPADAPPRRGLNAAQVACLVLGFTLVATGALGFFYNADFSTGNATIEDRDAVLGVLDVNGWHNIVHLATGALALAFAGSPGGARAYALAFGVTYLLVATLGFAYGDGDSIFKLIPVNTEDNVLHVVLGLAALWAGLISRDVPKPTTAPAT